MTRQSYAPEIRIIRVMCTGRVDLAFVFRALEKGADGVIVGGCWPGECHYVTEGNYDALGNMLLGRKLLERMGLNAGRLRLEWISAAEGARFAEVMSDFAGQLKELGPIGEETKDVALKIRALSALVPYVKLVEREKLRVPVRSDEAYREYYGSEETDRLIDELFADRLALGQEMLLLREKPCSTRELSERLGVAPSDVSRHMNESSRRGLVAYDVEKNCYGLV